MAGPAAAARSATSRSRRSAPRCARARSCACRWARWSSTGRICRSTPTPCWPRRSPAASSSAGATAYDLWRLPALPIGLSREHDWAAGTLSLSVGGMTALLRDLGREIARALPARNLLIVNGHGGNRGILEALGRELRGDFGLNLCALHLGALMSPVADAAVPEIHAGKDETSVMLALAPDLVRRERIGDLKNAAGWRCGAGSDPRSGDELAVVERRQAHRRSGRDRRRRRRRRPSTATRSSRAWSRAPARCSSSSAKTRARSLPEAGQRTSLTSRPCPPRLTSLLPAW